MVIKLILIDMIISNFVQKITCPLPLASYLNPTDHGIHTPTPTPKCFLTYISPPIIAGVTYPFTPGFE